MIWPEIRKVLSQTTHLCKIGQDSPSVTSTNSWCYYETDNPIFPIDHINMFISDSSYKIFVFAGTSNIRSSFSTLAMGRKSLPHQLSHFIPVKFNKIWSVHIWIKAKWILVWVLNNSFDKVTDQNSTKNDSLTNIIFN